MPTAVLSPITPEQVMEASKNYLRCLRLPPSSQVLIITDKLPKTVNIDPHAKTRVDLSASLKDQIGTDHKVVMIDFGEKPTEEELHAETERALKELQEVSGVDPKSGTTMIIYLGNDWGDRKGIYKAANEFGANHEVKMVGSTWTNDR